MSVTNLTSMFSEAGSSSTNYQRDETHEGNIAKKNGNRKIAKEKKGKGKKGGKEKLYLALCIAVHQREKRQRACRP